MAKTINFDKLRKRRRLIENIKRLAFLALVLAVVGVVLFLNNLFIERGTSIRVSDFIETRGGPGFPVDFPGGIIRDIKPMGKNLAVLTDTNLYIYNDKGRSVANIQRMGDRTVMLTNQGRILSFDPGHRVYRMHTPSRSDSGELENGVLAANALKLNNYFFNRYTRAQGQRHQTPDGFGLGRD